MKKLIFILFQCVACTMSAQNEGQNTLSLLFRDKAETEKWLAKNNIPALGIGYIRDGKIQDINVFGELEKGKPAPKNAIFNVASLTKPVTAMVTLKLVSEGKWDLDAPIFNYWTDPDIADDPRAKTLTTRHILSHQTGFPNWRWMNKSKKLAFDFTPGTKYQYSGEGLEYLRRALENKFNRPLEDLANELIFKPLQMSDTRFTWDSTAVETRFAKEHNKKGELYQMDKRTQANAADDLLTTIEDYSKFMVYVMNGAGLSDSTYKQLITNQVKVKNNKYFGLGWSIDRNIGVDEFILTHDGSDRGVKTIAIMLPKSKQGLVIFTNSDNGTDSYIPVILAYLGKLGQDYIDVETK